MSERERVEVVITGIQMSFRSMLALMVKGALASLPALAILIGVGTLLFMLLAASQFLGP